MSFQYAPYGLWDSDITSNFITSIDRVFLELRLDPMTVGKGQLYWLERRPKERGRGVVCSKNIGDKTLQWTPPEFSVRSCIHEYGGGSFSVYSGVLYFCNVPDNRIYMQTDFNNVPVPITPSNSTYRYADAFVTKRGIYVVREDLSKTPAQSTIVFIESGNRDQHTIAIGADFYSSPCVAPNERSIVWMQWDFPNMPWDSTQIWMASLGHDGCVLAESHRCVVGKPDVSYMQPKFAKSGELFFISDESNWWNLYMFSDTGVHKNLLPMDKEVGGPQWQLGESAYSFDPSDTGDIAVIFDGDLNIINRKSDLCYLQETGYFEHSYIHFGQDRSIYCIAADPKKFQAIVRFDVISGEVTVMEKVHPELDESLISVPEAITFAPQDTHKDNEYVVYSYLYNPKNPSFKPLANTLPPLVVFIHGGPTGRSNRCLDLRIQYYTSRGFAVLNVDYRGSSGYGRAYRQLLNSNMGVFDVEDCCNAAMEVVEDHKADPQKLSICGRSAGGYVVLSSLTFKSVFNAGVCHYGICDLVELQENSCKFELHYFDTLVAPYPNGIEIYRQRSPINFVERIKAPVLFFHGSEDKIVPVDQIKRIFEILKKRRNVMTSLVVFEAEGHGYRIDTNIQAAIDGEYKFLCDALNITVDDVKCHESINFGITP